MKGGYLIERRLQQRKWKWINHGNPKDHILSSITCLSEVNLAENANSLFLTTASGYIFEYRIPDHSGMSLTYLYSPYKCVNSLPSNRYSIHLNLKQTSIF